MSARSAPTRRSRGSTLLGEPTPGCVPRASFTQVGTVYGEPVDPGIEASYQDEFTIGIEKALDPTLSVGLKGTYRSLGRTEEDRCDLDYNTAPYNALLRSDEPGRHGDPSAIAPRTDNPNHRKTTAQISPRQFRFALKVTF